MIARILVVAVLCVVLALVVGSAAQSPQLTFGGQIISESDEPVAGNVTVFTNHEGLVASTVTVGSDGFFEVGVPAKPDRMLVWADGYAARSIDDPVSGATIVLTPLQTMEVHVRDWNGEPVRSTLIALGYVVSDGVYVPDMDERILSITDSGGRVLIPGVIPNAAIYLEAEYRGVFYGRDHVRVESNHVVSTTARGAVADFDYAKRSWIAQLVKH